ncbi:hypothetical protein [Haloterrigena salinisoli]|uniref:hypothetical protein n=1 Tax=Haloterrigena salinisoli TaxID=3132747 RepID=UPI0030CDD574
MTSSDVPDLDLDRISPLAWRLLRVAAGYEQRAVEREIDELMQAHISMLEGGNRSLSASRRRILLELYSEELTEEQIRAIVRHF